MAFNLALIDDSSARVQQVLTIFAFLECDVYVIADQDYAALQDRQPLDAVLLGYRSATTLDEQLSELALHLPGIPVYVLYDAGDESPLDGSQPRVARGLEWPCVYPVAAELLAHLQRRRQAPKKVQTHRGLAGRSAAIQKTRDLIDQVAKSDATVLILGESGTGKEVIAQALHRASLRKDKPFVPVNCGAIPGELLESELFGHEKGAFTGALTARQGRFELAEGGTLFLDEIGDMPMPMQVKLLRVLQERTFERVGSNKTIQCDVRILAATHRNLEREIEEKRFREDLFYRLNVFPIEVPSLRERAEDIPYLVQDLVARLETAGRGSVRLTREALAVLMQHPWPGNVRELANLIERLAIIYPDGLVDASDLPEKFQHYDANIPVAMSWSETMADDLEDEGEISPGFVAALAQPGMVQLPEQGIDLKEYLTELENQLIKQALDECNGVVAHAAKRLNMRRTTLVEKLRKVDTV
jgi:sigma-54 dependent transcriptional regulator, flagellar regulatory protein